LYTLYTPYKSETILLLGVNQLIRFSLLMDYERD